MKLTTALFRTGVIAIAILLPFGRLTSIFIFVLAFSWLAEGDFKAKINSLRDRPYIALFAMLPLMLAAGYFYSDDKVTALLRLKISLPVLVLPLIIGTSVNVNEKLRDVALLGFAASTLVAALAGIIGYYTGGTAGHDPREMALFMTHIRFSLIVNFAVAILVYFSIYHDKVWWTKAVYITGAAAMAAFLLMLGSLTGIAILMVLLMFYLYNYLTADERIPKPAALIAGSLPFVIVFVYVLVVWVQNFTSPSLEISNLDKNTINGNPYYHDVSSGVLENGHFTDIYVSEEELRREWNRAGIIPFDGKDLQGNDISYTLRRFLTSKDLRKDSAGFHQLTNEDIEAIGKGVANHRFSGSSFIFRRVYETLWEVHIYLKSGYVSGHSFAQRLAFWKTSIHVALDNILSGTGTGDVMHEIRNRALVEGYSFDDSWEGKPHNQFLYYFAGSGLPVLLLIVVSWLWPVLKGKKIRNPIVTGFLIISWMSMLTLDTLESHYSVVFYSFFYSLLVLSEDNSQPVKKG